MLEIDPQFRRMGKGARQRRLRSGLIRIAMAGIVLALGAGVIWHRIGPDVMGGRGDDVDLVILPVEEEFAIAPVVRGDTFTNIPGDPMIIPSGDDPAESGMTFPGPEGLHLARVGPPAPDQLTMIRENLHQREQRLVAALPTTREEFALFQAARSRERLAVRPAVDGPGLPGSVPLAGQSTSGIVFTRENARRAALWQDLIMQIRLPTEVAVVMQDNGFDRVTAERVAARLDELLDIRGDLPRGSVFALRYRIQDGAQQVLQLSLYRSGEYIGSLAMSGSGQLVSAADPWIGQDLLEQSAEHEAGGDDLRFRLLDVIYSTAIRRGVPAAVIGEAIALMSRVQDLDSFAAEGDQLELLYATRGSGSEDASGRILFVGLDGPSGRRSCYIVPQADGAPSEGQHDGDYTCHSPDARIIAAPARPAMSVPVTGALSGRFVPPDLGRDGGGRVSWRAAQGSPVMAVAAGRIAGIERGDRKGATVRISHPGGLESVYHGLDRMAANITTGAEVGRDMLIGRVAGGAAGLDFQLLDDNRPVDPLPYLTGGHEILGSAAVEALISRIIHVESAGNAAARNPLSTATGLGQFIESTWLRMMRSYRPDLVAAMDRQALLDLRLDPGLSRQMVRHLAQENEVFLRARGHPTTPGNLYLAHFLGPVGAARALGADTSLPVGVALGQAVVSANPFLRDYTLADLRLWAERKMNAQAVTVSTLVPSAPMVRASPEVKRFVELMDGILAAQAH